MRRLSWIAGGCRRFFRLPHPRRALLIEAALYLLLARLTLIIVPFPRLSHRIGTFVEPADPRAILVQQDKLPDQAHTALEVGWAVSRAAGYVPFKAMCLPQAMSAKAMLRRRRIKSVLHFGTMGGKKAALVAHVWLDAAGVEVTGYPVSNEFTEIACFV